MPRKTPVRELQKEESVTNSPLRRSSRLNNSSPVPTKVITRRNSASETPVSAPLVTRSRRSSFNQELQSSEDLQADKKKPTSTIRTRRSSLTQNKDDEVQVEPTVRTRARSKEPEHIPEVKKTTGRRRSITEDSENNQDDSKKATRSRSSSLSKKNEIIETQSSKQQSFSSMDVPASTPIKKSPTSQNTNDTLEPIEETNKEVESPSGTPSKKLRKRVTEVSRIDFDLSIINEASLTEEETSLEKKSTVTDKVEEDQSGTTTVQKNVLEAEKSKDSSKVVITDEAVKKSTKNEPELDSNVTKEDLPNKKMDTPVKHDSIASDSSFNLQLSSLENSNQNNVDANNKENISPKESQCEPMEVDEVFQESSPVKKKLLKSPKVVPNVEINEVEKKLQVATKITDKMAKFLSEEIISNSQKNKKGYLQDEVVLATTDEDLLNKNEKSLNLEETKDLNNGKNFEDEVSKEVEKHVSTIEDETEETPKKLTGPDQAVEETSETDAVKGTNSTENVSNEMNKSSEIKIEEKSTDKDVAQSSSNGDTEGEFARQIVENVESSPSKESLESDVKTVVQNLAKNPPDEKSPKTTPSKITSKMVKDSFQEETELEESVTPEETSVSEEKTPKKTPSKKDKDSFHEQAELEESVTLEETSVSDAVDRPDTSVENETKELSPVEEKKSLHKSTEEEMEEDSDEKSFCDKDKAATVVILNEKERVAVSDQKESSVSRQIKREEIVTVSQSSADEDLDLEVKIINESRTVVSEKSNSDEGSNVNLRDSDSSEEASDDEISISKKEKNIEKDVDNLERSVDSKYMIAMREKAQKGGKIQSDSNTELVELSDEEDEVFEETSDNEDSSDINQTVNAELVEKRNDKANKIKEEKNDVLNVSTSSVKKTVDRRSITLQETIKAGDDPEQKLSGHIHKVVDLFCANIKNKSDLSINVSMEYTEHISDSEGENGKADMVNISLTACDIGEKEVEPVKGSKRRKIFHVGNVDIKSPEKPHNNKNEDESIDDNPNEMSQNSSVINDEEKVSSTKKCKKRKSEILVKSPQKVSFSTDIEDKKKSAKKTKKRGSVGDVSSSENELTKQKEQEISPVKKPVPLTPFKAKTSKQLEESDIIEDSSDEDDEANESTTNIYSNFFSASFEESDDDVTWGPDEDVESDDSYSEIDNSVVEEVDDDEETQEEDDEESQEDEAPTATIKRRRQSNSRSSSEESSHSSEKNKKISQNGSSSSLEDILPDSVDKKEKNFDRNKKRKLFHLSRVHNLSQAFASSETEENVKMEQAISKKQSSNSVVDRKKSNVKNKKLKQKFSSETVECMLPETSEVHEKVVTINRKRRHPSSHDLENEEPIKSKREFVSKQKMKDTKRKHVSPKSIRPSASNRNLKPLRMKPSTKRNSGWDVTIM